MSNICPKCKKIVKMEAGESNVTTVSKSATGISVWHLKCYQTATEKLVKEVQGSKA